MSALDSPLKSHYPPSFLELIEKRLNELVPQGVLLHAAARYSLLSGGKRLRPHLLLSVLQAYSIPLQHGLDPACALEMIHTYSLIHDDLPCMDDDDFRRGKPSLHKAFSESTALLTGDYLLTYSFEVICASLHLSPAQKVDLIHLFAQSAGADGMIGGQIIDLLSASTAISKETLLQMHEAKTARLFVAALLGGAIIANAPEADRAILKSVGTKWGIAFQLKNDLLDVSGSFDETGKLGGADAKHHKSTGTSLLGIAGTQELVSTLEAQAARELIGLSCPAPFLLALLQL